MPCPFLTAEWRHLVMLNYEIDHNVLRAYLPRGVELDHWDGQHFVSIVGFMFDKTKVLGLPIPFHRRFAEVNLRFYVRRKDNGEWRRGVVFIREVAPRRAICLIARRVYNEQYVRCPMRNDLCLPAGGVGRVAYGWKWPGGDLEVAAEFAGEPQALEAESFEQFVAEHYWAYTRQRNGTTQEYHVTHPPWQIWNAKTHKLTGDPVAFYGSQFADTFSRPSASAFVADGSPVAVYPGHRLAE